MKKLVLKNIVMASFIFSTSQTKKQVSGNLFGYAALKQTEQYSINVGTSFNIPNYYLSCILLFEYKKPNYSIIVGPLFNQEKIISLIVGGTYSLTSNFKGIIMLEIHKKFSISVGIIRNIEDIANAGLTISFDFNKKISKSIKSDETKKHDTQSTKKLVAGKNNIPLPEKEGDINLELSAKTTPRSLGANTKSSVSTTKTQVSTDKPPISPIKTQISTDKPPVTTTKTQISTDKPPVTTTKTQRKPPISPIKTQISTDKPPVTTTKTQRKPLIPTTKTQINKIAIRNKIK